MNFGPKNAPAVFGLAMQHIFKDLYPTGWFYQYFDDLTICGNTTKELLDRLEEVLQRMKQSNLTIKLTKCEFDKTCIDILGSRISNGSLKIQPKYLDAVKNWKLTPQNAESFLGTVNYLSKFIPKLAELTKPIREIVERSPEKKGGLKQPKRSINDKEVQQNFEKIRTIILEDPELKGIDPMKPVIIRTDASEIAGGAVLLQNDKQGLRPRAYYSTTFTESERKWKSMVRKEALVMRKALQFFSHDIKCLKPGWITVQTDNQTLKHMIGKAKQHEDIEVQSAAYEIAMLNANIEHISGKNNYIADFLSQKDKRNKNPNDIERLIVGIVDDEFIIIK
jgi:RNase H-like domain found in reverse transcriptase/Reverse transcriptase (RNA-dependent DNA polymerase)